MRWKKHLFVIEIQRKMLTVIIKNGMMLLTKCSCNHHKYCNFGPTYYFLSCGNISFYVIFNFMALLSPVMFKRLMIVELHNMWVPWEILFDLWPSVRWVANPSRSCNDLSIYSHVLLYLGCYIMQDTDALRSPKMLWYLVIITLK